MENKTIRELNKWINIHKEYVKESTYCNYLTIINNHLSRDSELISIYSISNIMLQEYILYKLKYGSVSGGCLSSKTVRDILVVLKMFLKYCFHNNIIKEFNLNVKFPKLIHCNKPEIVENVQYIKLVNYLKENNNSINMSILLLLSTGIRVGELCALQYQDVDFNNCTIKITKTLQRIYYKDNSSKVVITTPKTSSSIREVPLSKSVMHYLKETNMILTNYITTNSSKYLEPRGIRSRMKSICKKIGIKYIKLHTLRHTFATKCIENKIDYKTLSVLLGHSTINTTLNLYVHPNMSQKKYAIDIFNSYLKI